MTYTKPLENPHPIADLRTLIPRPRIPGEPATDDPSDAQTPPVRLRIKLPGRDCECGARAARGRNVCRKCDARTRWLRRKAPRPQDSPVAEGEDR